MAEFSQKEIIFIAPDELFLALQNDPSFSNNAWLFVDEAAMLPIAQLSTFSHHFKHILFTTTIIVMRELGEALSLNLSKKLTALFLTLSLLNRYVGRKDDALEAFYR